MTYVGEREIKDTLIFYQNKIKVVNIYSKPKKVICVEVKIPIKKKWLFFYEYKYFDLEFHYNETAETLDSDKVERVIFFDFGNHKTYFECGILNNTKELIAIVIFKAQKLIEKYQTITIPIYNY